MAQPADRLYTKEHEWVKIDGTNAVVGITDYAQSSLGDIVYVEMPRPGVAVERGKPVGVVESVKAVSDLYSPIAGEILEVNEELDASPALVNEQPYDAGWILRLRPANVSDIESLLDSAAYEKLTAESH